MSNTFIGPRMHATTIVARLLATTANAWRIAQRTQSPRAFVVLANRA